MVTTALRELVASTTGPDQAAQLENLAADPRANVLAAWSAIGRKVGKATVASSTPLGAFDGRGHDELVRGWLLVTAAQTRRDAEMLELVGSCWARGDNRERHAVLRALPLLPNPAQYVSLAVEACRTSVQTIFEAIACENPFPARHFPELNFNQLVLKALFNAVALERITGLAERRNAELSRMATDYRAERLAAGRSVPPDIDFVIQPGDFK